MGLLSWIGKFFHINVSYKALLRCNRVFLNSIIDIAS